MGAGRRIITSNTYLRPLALNCVQREAARVTDLGRHHEVVLLHQIVVQRSFQSENPWAAQLKVVRRWNLVKESHRTLLFRSFCLSVWHPDDRITAIRFSEAHWRVQEANFRRLSVVECTWICCCQNMWETAELITMENVTLLFTVVLSLSSAFTTKTEGPTGWDWKKTSLSDAQLRTQTLGNVLDQGIRFKHQLAAW